MPKRKPTVVRLWEPDEAEHPWTIRIEPIKPAKGKTVYGYADPNTRSIVLNSRVQGDRALFLTLLHECVHVASGAVHFEQYGDGVFMHPHEIVGCMFGQQLKLSAAADASIYTGDTTEFRERCMKTLFAILCGTMSVDRLSALKAVGESSEAKE